MTKYVIRPTLAEEALEPWVWATSEINTSNGFIKIENPLNGNKIVVFKRTIDENFIETYKNKPRTIPINSTGNYLIINEYYRKKLQVGSGNEIDLLVKNANWWDKIYFMHISHPHPTVQYANRMTILAFLMGIVGLVLAILPFVKSTCP